MRGNHRLLGWLSLVAFLVIYAVILLRNAWLCDDAYISLRTVDNFVNGYGLVWNVGERVQAYTHPLWVFLIAPIYALTREVYFTVLSISVVLSLAAAAVYAFGIARTTFAALLGVLALSLSAAFVDFSTSGLENPLTYFLFALFLVVYFRAKFDQRSLFYLSLLAALAAVNRLDTILLYIPMLIYFIRQMPGRRWIRPLALGFLPLIGWELFSLVYYGFPFPNTAYAKLDTGIDKNRILMQGVNYLVYSWKYDPVTIIVLSAGVIVPFVMRDKRTIASSSAIVLYTMYIIYIGGCFMSGRYLAAPTFLAVAALSQYRKTPWPVFGAALIIILIAGLTATISPIYTSKDDQGDPERILYGIVNERAWYNRTHGLINYDGTGPWPDHHWIDEGMQWRRKNERLVPHVAVGMVGYYAGPQVAILDVYAVTDPLLARLPVAEHWHHRIGHFGRTVPPGYKRTLATGKNYISDPALAQYYDKLSILTRGSITSINRLWEIVKFNLGWYDHWVEKYLLPHLVLVDYEDIKEVRTDDIIDAFANNYVFHGQGLEIDLGRIRHSPEFEFSRDRNDAQRIEFYRGGKKIAEQILPATPVRRNRIATASGRVPENAILIGYDKLRIVPERDDGGYHGIGHLRLLDS